MALPLCRCPTAAQPLRRPARYATAWTGGYATDQPLSYTSFQTSGAPEQRPPLKCGGCGEQWVLFLCGILIWPLWYVALIWGCVKPEQRNDPRCGSLLFLLLRVRAADGWTRLTWV